MTGFRSSYEQAQRLWALAVETCATLLECLVEAGFLQGSLDGRYVRVSKIRTPDLPCEWQKQNSAASVGGASGSNACDSRASLSLPIQAS